MVKQPGSEYNYLLSIAGPKHFNRIIKYMFDEGEFLSDYGIRSLSKYHKENPFVLCLDGQTYTVPYTSGESKSNLFGGNSNWRGPIWFPGTITLLLFFIFECFFVIFKDSMFYFSKEKSVSIRSSIKNV